MDKRGDKLRTNRVMTNTRLQEEFLSYSYIICWCSYQFNNQSTTTGPVINIYYRSQTIPQFVFDMYVCRNIHFNMKEACPKLFLMMANGSKRCFNLIAISNYVGINQIVVVH